MKTRIIKNVYEIEAYVESETKEGMYYLVTADDFNDWQCTCPQNRIREVECKHIKLLKEELGDN